MPAAMQSRNDKSGILSTQYTRVATCQEKAREKYNFSRSGKGKTNLFLRGEAKQN